MNEAVSKSPSVQTYQPADTIEILKLCLLKKKESDKKPLSISILRASADTVESAVSGCSSVSRVQFLQD